jgi:LysR family nitrogen assimilation transcriptional regulator
LIFEDMSAFVVVARMGSFSRAAVELCIAQSALSKRVRRLESRLGTALLERRARGVVLTEAGQVFLVRAQRLVDETADLERNLSNYVHTPSGEVRLAFPQRTCGLLAPPVIERCLKELPLVAVQVLEGTPAGVHGWLLRGEADLAMTYNPELGTDFLVRPFAVEPLFLIGPGPAAAGRAGFSMPEVCSFQDLATLPLILPKKPNIVRVIVDRLCVGHGVRPNVIYETDGTQTIRGMVERGMGVTVFTLNSTWSETPTGAPLAASPFSSPLMNWKLCFVRARASLNNVAVNRVQQIVEQEAELLFNSGLWKTTRIIEPQDASGAA